MPKYDFLPIFDDFWVHFHPTLSHHRILFLLINVSFYGLTSLSKDGTSISTAYSLEKSKNFKDAMILKLHISVISLSLIKISSDCKTLLQRPPFFDDFMGGL